MRASQRGDIPLLRTLLRQRAKLDSTDTGGQTAMHVAAATSQVAVVQLLLAQRADPAPLNNEGATPLRLAVNTLHHQGEAVDARRVALTLEALLRAEEQALRQYRLEAAQAAQRRAFGVPDLKKSAPPQAGRPATAPTKPIVTPLSTAAGTARSLPDSPARRLGTPSKATSLEVVRCALRH